ncbi:hypothetical protein FO519_001487 [Halicephalobus sp. NKZ332]|nr:hypothetical protein FO519_001487 [Halicephalobus sp. NKZ332]
MLSETIVGSVPIGLNAASDSLSGMLPGIMHKTQLHPDIQLGNFVIADRRMPARCPCCGKDAQLYCPNCVWATFFQSQGFARRRDEWNRRKAELGTRLKTLFEQEGNDQSQLFQKQRRIAELRNQIKQKRDNIEHLKVVKERKANELSKMKRNVDALRKKADDHHKKINDNKERELKLQQDLNRIKLRRYRALMKRFEELLVLFPMIEAIPQRSDDDEPDAKIIQMIEEAAFSDKAARYSEVAKRRTVPKVFYKIRQCLVPGTSDYTDLLSEISDHRTVVSRGSKETVAGLAFTAQFINSLSYLFDIYIPFRLYIEDLLTCETWTRSLFQTDIFCLNLSIVLLCMHAGIETRNLDLSKPFENLKLLREALSNKEPGRICFFENKEDKLHQQVLDELENISWEESPETGLDVNEVEEDWVNVYKTK